MHVRICSSLLILVLGGSMLQVARAQCPPGDLNGDCTVGFEDVRALADQWLLPPGSPADLDGLNGVEARDFALLAGNWARKGIPLVINEFMASNSSVKADPQGEYDDWIEIYNAGSEPIDLAGMYLTDDLGEPTKWRIPAGMPGITTLDRGGYILIWADNDTADPGLHAAFELNSDREEIGLFDSDPNILIDSVEFARQSIDVSHGRFPDGNDLWQFFAFPSPGWGNIGAYQGLVDDVKFSIDRGFYDEPFAVTLATDTPGAVIYYTLDGSQPYEMSGRFPRGVVYTAPVLINKTTCLRAKAIKMGWKPSDTDTQTYIFLDNVIDQSNGPAGFPPVWGSTSADYEMDAEIVNDPLYAAAIKDDLKSIPSMSLVTMRENLFDAATGIYANPWSEGPLWERPASLELIYPDGSEGFQINCGVRIYGGVGRREKKKTFRFLFKGIYGASKLRYPLFGPDAVDEFDTIILRSEFNDGWQWDSAGGQPQYARDEFIRRTQLALGSVAPHGGHVHLYVDGLYWGLYNVVERPDAGFGASYTDSERDQWDGTNSGTPVNADGDYERYARTVEAWNTMLSLAGAVSSAPNEQARNAAYQKLQGKNPDGTDNPQWESYLDADQYIGYLIANYYGGNTDWPHKNFYVGRENRPDSAGFKFFSWDAEWTLNLRCNVNTNQIGNGSGVAAPFQRLRSCEEFRTRFGDHVHKAFFNGGPLYVDPANTAWNPTRPERNVPAARYMEIIQKIERPIVPESARWGDQHRWQPYTRELEWRNELINLINNYFPRRSGIVLQHFRDAGLYPAVAAPVFYVNGSYRHGGYITSTDLLSMSAPAGATYYTLDGSDPRAETLPQPGTSVTLVTGDAAKRALVPAGPVPPAWQSDPGFDDWTWSLSTTPPGGVGYERNTGYEGLITLNVHDQMYGKSSGCYIRIPFGLSADAGEFTSMTLRIWYDDAFVAYLNGDEIERSLFTGEPLWNSHSDTSREASMAEPFDVSDHIGSLKQGTNILAIHGMNSSSSSSDFIIWAELLAVKGGSNGGGSTPSGAILYGGPVTLAASARVKARVKSGSTWSALNEAVYSVGAVAENVRISEMMYHPYDANDPNDPNEEYIELTNIGAESINLNLVRFT
ncbi:MAG: lamin tail domain-containing protein, partial [Phycisphaerales bacterium]